MTISQRIFALLKEKGLKQKQLAEYTGISTSAISAWSKKNTSPAAESLSAIADFLGVSIDYLLRGVDNTSYITLNEHENELLRNYRNVDDIYKAMIRERAQALAELAAERAEQERAAAEKQKCIALSVSSARTTEEQDDFYVDICNLPVSAGTGVYLDDNHTEPLKIKHTAIAERANYAVRVSGDSMTPEYYDGDIVLVETCPSVNIGEIGIFVVDGEGYIKQFGGDKLISLNSKYPDISLRTSESASCRGRVLGIAEPIK